MDVSEVFNLTACSSGLYAITITVISPKNSCPFVKYNFVVVVVVHSDRVRLRL
jgi:hypothetical protein